MSDRGVYDTQPSRRRTSATARGTAAATSALNPLAKLVEDPAFDPDQVDQPRRSLRVEPPAHLDGLPHADAMAAHRPRLHIGQARPVEDMDGPGGGAELHGIDHHQPLLAVEFIEEIDAAKPEKREARSLRQRHLAETVINGLSDPVIGNQIIADADDQGRRHDYCRGRLKAMLKVQDSPVEMVFGLTGQPVSSARMPAI